MTMRDFFVTFFEKPIAFCVKMVYYSSIMNNYSPGRHLK